MPGNESTLIAKTSFVLSACLLLLPTVLLGQTAPEYAIKAAYIGRFTEFTQWPEDAIEKDNPQAFIVSVIGDAPLGEVFERTLSALKIKNRNVEVRQISFVREAEGSQVLFISGSEEKQLGEITAYTRDRPILTISDTEGFARKGVIINFYPEAQKVRFEINPSAAEESGLRISSLLLEYARIVDPEAGRP